MLICRTEHPNASETPGSFDSDRPLQDRANLIDRRFLPHPLAFHIVSDTDNLLQILPGQPGKGTLFPSIPLDWDPGLPQHGGQWLDILLGERGPVGFRVQTNFLQCCFNCLSLWSWKILLPRSSLVTSGIHSNLSILYDPIRNSFPQIKHRIKTWLGCREDRETATPVSGAIGLDLASAATMESGTRISVNSDLIEWRNPGSELQIRQNIPSALLSM